MCCVVQVREQRGASEGDCVSFEDVTLVREEGEVHYGHLETHCEEGEDEESGTTRQPPRHTAAPRVKKPFLRSRR